MQTHAQSQVTHVQLHIHVLLYTRTRTAVQMGRDATRPQPARDVRCSQHMLTPAESARDPGAPAQTAGSRTPATRRVHRVSARRADVTVTLARSQHARCGRCRHSRARNAKRGAGAYLRREWTRNHGACCSLADQEAAHGRAKISTRSATARRARAA